MVAKAYEIFYDDIINFIERVDWVVAAGPCPQLGEAEEAHEFLEHMACVRISGESIYCAIV